MAPNQDVEVEKIPPPGVSRATRERSDDLLGKHHLQRVAADSQFATEQPWQPDLLWRRRNGVAHVDVHMKPNLGS